MEIKQLTAVVTVAETGSVTKAAQLLHLVQSAVTRQIIGLEEELGVALFERTRQGMVPTAAGAALVERSRRVLVEIERARAEIRPTRGHVTGIVHVGILGATLELLAQPLLEAVAEKYPGVDLRMSTAYSGHLQQWLDAGDLDLSLVYNLESSPSVHVVPLLSDQLWAVAPRDAGLRPDQPVDVAEALRQPFIMPVPGHGLRVLLDQARLEAQVKPNVIMEANSWDLQKLLVKAGCGWTALPAPGVAADLANGTLSAAPLQNPEIRRTIALGLARTGRTPPAVEAVAAELIRIIRATVGDGRWPAARLIEE
ncbi:LysR substrate-binding domain-containing protein [Streptomyces sp. NPDC008092]|uniref:LysR family transcriptional regulator n=1 Tax=Streptomyces sp. NPDC008092 TaxID=3364808 RepID=UPI0036E810B2